MRQCIQQDLLYSLAWRCQWLLLFFFFPARIFLMVLFRTVLDGKEKKWKGYNWPVHSFGEAKRTGREWKPCLRIINTNCFLCFAGMDFFDGKKLTQTVFLATPKEARRDRVEVLSAASHFFSWNDCIDWNDWNDCSVTNCEER